MKLIKNIIDKQYSNSNIVLSWLYWIEDHCFGRPCDECLYWKSFEGRMNCEICQVYRKAFPETAIFKYVCPSFWNLPSSSIEKVQPPNLDFIARVKWSKNGLLDVRRDEDEIIKSID